MQPNRKEGRFGGLLQVLTESPPYALLSPRIRGYAIAALVCLSLFISLFFNGGSASALTYDAATETSSASTPSSNSYELAKRESLGFMDDIREDSWELLREKVKDVYPNVKGGDYSKLRGQAIQTMVFFQDHFEPDFVCQHERRIGRLGDGGKWVCDPHRLKNRSCLVYSVGSNGDASFEEAVKKQIGKHCEIHTFDMKNHSKVVEATGSIFHQWGISASNSTDKRGRVFRTLKSTMEELGHVGKAIDIFKIDCEGCEWDLYPSFFEPGVDLRQILIEIHSDRKPEKEMFARMPRSASEFFERFYREGYVIFHKEINIRWWRYGQCIEYAFLKLHKDFFKDIPGLSGT